MVLLDLNQARMALPTEKALCGVRLWDDLKTRDADENVLVTNIRYTAGYGVHARSTGQYIGDEWLKNSTLLVGKPA